MKHCLVITAHSPASQYVRDPRTRARAGHLGHTHSALSERLDAVFTRYLHAKIRSIIHRRKHLHSKCIPRKTHRTRNTRNLHFLVTVGPFGPSWTSRSVIDISTPVRQLYCGVRADRGSRRTFGECDASRERVTCDGLSIAQSRGRKQRIQTHRSRGFGYLFECQGFSCSV